MIFLLYVPHENALIHSGWDYKAWVGGPAQVQHVLRVAHQSSLRRPPHHALWSVDGYAVFAPFPDSDTFIIGTWSQQATVGRVAHDVGVFVGLEEPIEDAYVFLVGVDWLSIVDDLPELDAPLGALTFLFHESLFIWACACELIFEGVKVDGENAILGAVPAHFGWLNSHNLAVSLYYSSKSQWTLNTPTIPTWL